MQLNVNLNQTDAKRVKRDAVALGVTLSAYAAQAFQNFLAKPVAVRRVYFEKKHRKIVGRRINHE